jgi:tripartite-type tricarboxylate transporter receptor subunit TctC
MLSRFVPVTERQSRRATAGAFAAGLIAMALHAALPCPGASAQTYPSRPVTIIVPFAAGGSADVYARLLAPLLEQEFGKPFIVDDRPGAGSLIGSEFVKTSAPDGCTLLLVSNAHTVNETLFAKKPFKLMSDFVAVAPINSADLVLVTRNALGVKTLPELIDLAKKRPGGLTFASSGPGTPYHMAGELFKEMAGIDILHIPYRGSSAARTDVIGGHVDMMFDAPTTMDGFIASGMVTGIATTGRVRSDVLPNLPMASETVPGYEAVIWLGLMAPKGTPDDVIRKLNAALSKIVRNPEVRTAWKKLGADPVTMSPDQFAEFLRNDITKWAEVVKLSGAKVGP